MAQTKGKGNRGNKGFGSMDQKRQREISSRGGRASAQGDTSNRGFASMNKDKQRKISSQGGKASQGGSSSGNRRSGSSHKNEEDFNRYKVREDQYLSERDLNSLEEEDEIVNSRRGLASYSETDEDEDEGVGDGNIGRSIRSLGSDEEG